MQGSTSLLKQATRFVLVGVLNTGIDFGVFNLFALFLIGLATTADYFVCKTIAFLVAMANSFFFNSRFTFQGNAERQGVWWKFPLVTVCSFLMGLAVSTAVFHLLMTQSSLSALWAGNISAGISTLVGLCSNFIGYKWFVFKHE